MDESGKLQILISRKKYIFYLYIFILIILNKYLFITVNSPRTLSNFIKYLRPKSWITKEPIGKFDIFIHFKMHEL